MSEGEHIVIGELVRRRAKDAPLLRELGDNLGVAA
jgi:hypothetical protein